MKQNRITNKLLPPRSRRRNAIKVLLTTRNTIDKKTINYSRWISDIEPQLWSRENKHKLNPLVSIVTPAFNTPDKYVKPLVESLVNQTYPNWQLCLVDASTDKERSSAIERISLVDSRITYKKLKENYGIVGNTNEAIKIAEGDYIGFLDHDDTLSEHALYEVVAELNEHPETDLFYSDEDKLSDNGKKRLLPFFKPGWSPELLLGVNYITHFTVVRKKTVEEISGLRAGFDGAQDYDFLLRLTEKSDRIIHIPKVLYHWRQAEGSTAVVPGEKSYADTAGQRALRDAVERRRINAEVLEIPDRPTNYRLKYGLPKDQPLVSIIIPFKDKANLLEQCLNSIFTKTTYKNYEIILVSNNSEKPETGIYLNGIKNQKKVKLFKWDKPFNYAALNNFGRSKSVGEYLVLLNNDTEVITPEWLEELIGVASQPDIGAVGPTLFYPNHTIQHAGVVLGLGGMAGHVFRKHHINDWTDFGLPSWPRDYLAVTGACLVVETKKYDIAGGLDETFTMAGNDVALGITLYKKGFRNVYWPFAELIHHENQSVGSYQNAPVTDYNHSLEYYRPYLNGKDPYFNPNLDLMTEQIGLRRDYAD